jgi:hypothetical protein
MAQGFLLVEFTAERWDLVMVARATDPATNAVSLPLPALPAELMMEWPALAAIVGVLLLVVVAWRRVRRSVDVEVGPVSSDWLRDQRGNREGWQP